jgi:chemotaxis protein methyltransferase CheR
MSQTPGISGVASRSVAGAGYEQFRAFLEEACGILLGDNKQYLVSSRLNKLMAENGVSDLGELVEKIKSFSHRSLKNAVIDAMTTNETLWFRDTHPFEIFKKRLIPEKLETARGSIRVWSAACSSGQEPYSLSMLVSEYNTEALGRPRAQVDIVATDLSPSMLDCCREAVYDSLSLGRGLSKERHNAFFDALSTNSWQVKREIRSRVRFQQLNLMDSFLPLGKFDIVFCRNVLIYFSADLKADILRRIHGSLNPGGYLILGASEGLANVGELFEMVQCSPGIIYRAIK